MEDFADFGHLRRRGAQQSSLRNHNERMCLSMLREHGPLASSEIAKALNVSAQTGSVLVRALDAQGLVVRLEPVKGKVGKPQEPIGLNPEGAYSFGLRIGRRRSDMVLIDFRGQVVGERRESYRYPTPHLIETFVAHAMPDLTKELNPTQAARIVGLGIAAPFELWNWLDSLGAPLEDAALWRNYRFEDAFKRFTDLPISVANDVNLACTGELHIGTGRHYPDFLYFYLGAFVGGAIVLNGQVFHGRYGNAGAFGSIPVATKDDPNAQMIASSSLVGFEQKLAKKLGRKLNLRDEPELWRREPDLAQAWIEDASKAIARAAISVVAALDVTNIVIDGVFPEHVRTELAARLRDATQKLDHQGIRTPVIVEGKLGARAGALGAAYQPLLQALFVEGSALTV